MLLDEPISAHAAGLGINCPRFDRDVPEIFVVPKKNDDTWINIITQIERVVIQVHSWDEKNFDGTIHLRWRLNMQHLSPSMKMIGDERQFYLPGAQIRGIGWKIEYCEKADNMRLRVNFEASLIERKARKETVDKDGDFVRVSVEFLEKWRDFDKVVEKLKKYDPDREGRVIEQFSLSEMSLNAEAKSIDTRMILQENSGDRDDEEFCEVLASDGYDWVRAENRDEAMSDYARGANRPQAIWWDETLGTDAAFWVDDDLNLCAKGKVD
ncbi:Oidioi.mRNA.OKI2018_I69.XSR.g15288.t1.cds [Oikopleura dioica]|nr:Oidioi.mRNA.OKI2018_I69.XSR.g15288.t1.cds [Oikopleura dioica]